MTAPSLTAHAIVPDAAARRRAYGIFAVLSAMALVVLDAAIVNVALASIGHSLQVGPALSVRVVTAYQLGLVMSLLPAAALGESLGFRRVFALGATLFTAASVLCALSPTLPWLVAARLLQGIGGAAIMALGIALLRSIVPADRLGFAIGWNALTVALASAAGPTLGAMILAAGSWPLLFLVNVPIGACVLLAARCLPKSSGSGRPWDNTSGALNAFTFALLVIGADYATSRPALASFLFVASAALAILLVRRESARSAPLVPLDLLRQRSIRVAAVASVLCFAGQTTGLVALPFLLQHAFGLSPLIAGAYLTPWPLAVAVAAPMVGRLADRIHTAWLCLAGAGLLALGLSVAAAWPIQQHPLGIGVSALLCGLGFSLFNVPNNRTLFISAPRERSGAAGGLQGVARLAGQTLGALLMTVLFDLLPFDTATRTGLAVAAMITLAAGVTSILRSKESATTLVNA